MDINKLLQRLKLASQNPDLGIAFSNEEILQVSMALLSSQEATNQAIESGKVKGQDGATPVAGTDFLSEAQQREIITVMLTNAVAKESQKVDSKLAEITSGKDGSDAEITPDMIMDIAEKATAMVNLPDFDKLITERTTANPESIRDALELLQGNDRLSIDSIKGTEKWRTEMGALVKKGLVNGGGGFGPNTVLKMIEENGSGASDFISLTDTPSTYTGNALKVMQVNAGETALEFITLAGGGDALTANPLSQFAATTSLQLKGVLSDETGSGAAVFGTAPTVSSPVINTTISGTAVLDEDDNVVEEGYDEIIEEGYSEDIFEQPYKDMIDC